MALIVEDRVRDVSTTTGTGNFTVTGTAPIRYRSFDAVTATGDTFPYLIVHQAQDEWEVGLATKTASNQFARTEVYSSSNADALVNFSAGNKDVVLVHTSSPLVEKQILVNRAPEVNFLGLQIPLQIGSLDGDITLGLVQAAFGAGENWIQQTFAKSKGATFGAHGDVIDGSHLGTIAWYASMNGTWYNAGDLSCTAELPTVTAVPVRLRYRSWDSLGNLRVIFRTNADIGSGAMLLGRDANPVRTFHPWCEDSVTNAVTFTQRHTHTTDGTPAAGMGVGEEYEVETAAGNNEVISTVEARTTSVSPGAEAAKLISRIMAGGALQDPQGLSFYFRTLAADTAGQNNTTTQPWFPGVGADAINVEANTAYHFVGQLDLTTGTTTHTTATAFNQGTATISSIDYQAMLWSATPNSIATAISHTFVNSSGVTVLNATSTSAGTHIRVEGIVRFSAAGTFIPSFDFSAAPGSCTVLRNSFFKMRQIGTDTVVQQGPWS